ncbi:hypothetical protein TWF173_007516 [Orbilia oligospora]|nr:hypothetical protein TWF173_007516 [Orbilia oligospora]
MAMLTTSFCDNHSHLLGANFENQRSSHPFLESVISTLDSIGDSQSLSDLVPSQQYHNKSSSKLNEQLANRKRLFYDIPR